MAKELKEIRKDNEILIELLKEDDDEFVMVSYTMNLILLLPRNFLVRKLA